MKRVLLVINEMKEIRTPKCSLLKRGTWNIPSDIRLKGWIEGLNGSEDLD